jgi:uncharacterized repeat protein (TIGR01451 family)
MSDKIRKSGRTLYTETLESRALMAADAFVSWTALNSQPLIAETQKVSLRFDNAGSTVGFGPYIDIVLPSNSTEGGTGGVHYVPGTSSMLELPLRETTLTFDANGKATHPLAKDTLGKPLVLTGTPGNQLVVLELPFGSYVSDQPAVQVDMQIAIDATAALGRSLQIVATGGFRFGSDSLDNPTKDPSTRGAASELTITPNVVSTKISYLGPENETATGKSFERAYRVDVDVAAGADISDLVLVNHLDNNQVFLGATDWIGLGKDLSIASQPIIGAPSVQGDLILNLAKAKGVAGVDGSYLVRFYIPELNANDSPVIESILAKNASSIFTVQARGDWNKPAIFLDEPSAKITFNTDQATHTLQDKVIAVQQSVRIINDVNTKSLSPGDTLEYAIDFQVSDYASLNNVSIVTQIPNGQQLLASQPVMYSVGGVKGLSSSQSNSSKFGLQRTGDGDSSTIPYAFDLSNELRAIGLNGALYGAAISQGTGTSVTGRLTYRTQVLDQFQKSVPSNDLSVDERDTFITTALLSGTTIDLKSNTDTKIVAADGSGTRQQINAGTLQTSVYAINGTPVSSDHQVSAGDSVTYRIQRTIQSSDIEDLVINDYLPMPIHSASQVLWTDRGSKLTSGTLQLGPQDTFHKLYGTAPKINLDSSNNRVSLTYGDFDSPANESTVLDLLLTVAVEDKPFADGMWLTNLANVSFGSSNNGSSSQSAMSSIQYTRPVLSIVKGIAAADNPRAIITPPNSLDANLSGVDAGDKVRFRIVVSNMGLGPHGAFDTLIRDTIPAGFVIPGSGLDLTVTDGSGTKWKYTAEEAAKDDASLFSLGLRVMDPIPGGPANGTVNQVVISYSLELSDSVKVNTTASSEASIIHYAAVPKGQNYVTSKIADSASTRTANASIQHTLISTDQPQTSGNRVVIGETATFQAHVTFPEGRLSNALMQINLPRGMAIKELLDISVSDKIKFETSSLEEIKKNATIGSTYSDARDASRQLSIRLGDIDNLDRDNLALETMDVTYTATVTNDFDSNAGTILRNTASIAHQTGSASATASLSVVEPALEVVKSWRAIQVDAADKVTVSLDVRSASNSGSTAYDVSLVEKIAEGVTYVPGSLRMISFTAKPLSFSDEGSVIRGSWSSVPTGQICRFEYDVIVNKNVTAGQTLKNQSTLEWTSLPGEPGQIVSTNKFAYERTGDASDPGTEANDYRKTFESSIRIAPVQLAMRLIETSQPLTLGSQVTIGEREVFEVTATIPEGVHQLSLSSVTDQLDSLLNIESLELISVGKNLTGDFIKPGINAKLDNKNMARIDLGWITNNPDNVATDADKLVFRLVTHLPNNSINQAGDLTKVSVDIDYRYGVASTSNTLTIVEPKLTLTQKLSVQGVDADDTVDATIIIEHSQGSSSAAMEIELGESISGKGLTIVPGSIVVSNAKLVSSINSDQTIQLIANDMALGSTVLVRYQLKVSRDVLPGQIFDLPVSLKWTSLAGEGARSYTSQSNTTITVNSTALSGVVFVDTNQDGLQQSGDFGISGVEVDLTGTDHLGNKVSMTQITDGNGRYRFDSLRPGLYTLTETQPESFFDGLDFAGSLKGTVGDDVISSIRVGKGSNGEFGGYRFTESPLTWISGTVFVDKDQDHKLGQVEEGIPGIKISLIGKTVAGDPIERTIETNSRGYFVFGYLEPGTYSVIEGATDGFFDAAEQLGNRGGIVRNDRFDNVFVTASKPGSMYNFGEYRPASINGQIYVDYDRDGVLDRKDGLVANIPITLTGKNDLGEAVKQSARTDTRGQYQFEQLRPGSYDIQSQSLDGLDPSVSNVGMFNSGASRVSGNGVGVLNGFRSIQLPAGAIGNAYNIGHVDPNYEPSILETDFENAIVFNGTNGNDTFVIKMSGKAGQITINGETTEFDNSQTLSVRILGSFGNDTIVFTGSENKESVDLRRGSATVTGTWFESRMYGMESIRFIGGGEEDLARFYDTPGNDRFVGAPLTGTMAGDGYTNSVEDVHRIYAYATTGIDDVVLTGSPKEKDDFNATPDVTKLYSDNFYLYTTGFDVAQGIATDGLDRANLFDSSGDDTLVGDEQSVSLSSKSYRISAKGYAYANVSGAAGGTDTATLTGSVGDDQLTSRPLNATFDIRSTRVIAQGFEKLTVQASSGNDTATVYDSNYQDTLTADPTSALLRNATGDVQMYGFEQLTALMEAGGDDTAVVRGSTSIDTFKASPDSWSLLGTGYALVGTGFTKVTVFGDANDVAYLYDSAYNDILELTPDRATLKGQRYQNEALGFGKVNAEATGGYDRVLFFDSIVRSTVRYTEQKTTIFGTNFSHNATNFDTVDAYYSDLNGLDNVELSGRIEYAMLASDIAIAKYKLSIRNSAIAPSVSIKTRVDKL